MEQRGAFTMKPQMILCGLAVALAGFIGFWAGSRSAPSGHETIAGTMLLADDPLLSEWFLHNNGGIQTYASLRYKHTNGSLPFPAKRIGDFETAETLDASNAILLYGAYPAANHALYAMYRSLKYRSGQDSKGSEFAGSILVSLKFAEGAKYLAALDGDQAIYDAASRAQRCTLMALATGQQEDIKEVCVRELKHAFEAATGASLAPLP